MTALLHVWLSLTARSLFILGIAALLIVVTRAPHVRHAIWTVAILCALALPIAVNVLPRVGVELPAAMAPAAMAPALLAWLWPLGALVVWARFILGVARLRRIARGARAADEVWQERIRELGATRKIAVLRGAEAVVPVTWGIWRPAILLPRDADSWPPEQQRAVLLHELEHIRRHDCLIETIARFTCGLYWINPLAWIGARQLNTLREFACDAAVVRRGISPAEYGSQLIDMARAARIRALPIAPIASAAGLPDRIRRLGAIDAPAPRRAVVAPLLVVLAFVAVSAIDVARADGRWRSHATDRVTSEARPGGRVVITMSGHAPMPVTVTTWEQSFVEVTADKASDRAGDAAATALRAVEITAKPSAEGVDVRTVVDERAGNVRVRLTARVPVQTDLVVTTMGGGVQVGDGFASVDASTEGGRIVIGSTSGSVRAKTGGGDVQVTIPENADPAIVAKTTGATAGAPQIRSVLPLRITSERVNNGIEPYWQLVGKRDGTSGSVEISTGAGVITIGRAPRLAVERWIGTADGSWTEVRVNGSSASITEFAPAPMGFDVLARRFEAPLRDVPQTLLRAAGDSTPRDTWIGTFRIDGRDYATTWREYGDLRLIDLASGTSRTLVPLADGSFLVPATRERVALPQSTKAFTQRRVSFASGTTRLAGTLIVPHGTIRAGIVIVHGSGPIYRTAMFHRAAIFARLGIATLVYDKRGTGQSEGDVAGADVLTLAADATAAAEHLRSLLNVPVGFQGHSEAGSVISHAAAASGAAFAIIVSGTPLSLFAVEEYQKRNALEAAGVPKETIDRALALLRDVLEHVARGGDRASLEERYRALAREPWFTKLGLPREPPPPGVVTPSMTKTRINLTAEFPRAAFASIPLLVLLGAEDRVVPPHESERAWSEVLRDAAHPMTAVVVIPRADHGLKVPAYETMQRRWLSDVLNSLPPQAKPSPTSSLPTSTSSSAASIPGSTLQR